MNRLLKYSVIENAISTMMGQDTNQSLCQPLSLFNLLICLLLVLTTVLVSEYTWGGFGFYRFSGNNLEQKSVPLYRIRTKAFTPVAHPTQARCAKCGGRGVVLFSPCTILCTTACMPLFIALTERYDSSSFNAHAQT